MIARAAGPSPTGREAAEDGGRAGPAERLAYLALRAVLLAFRVLPRRAGETAGELAGRLLHRTGVRRRVVTGQLRAAFPERTDAWVEERARRVYLHLGRELAAFARLERGGRGGAAGLVRRTANVVGLEAACRKATAGGAGAVLVAGHLGNWEVGLAALGATGVPASVVVKRQRNPLVDRWLRRRRAGLGVEPLYMEQSGRRVPAALARGRVVVLAADQHAAGRGLTVPFMGRPASTHRGPAAFSLRCGVPILFAAAVRERNGYRMVVERVVRRREAPGLQDGPERSGRERLLTRRWVEVLEREVRRRPEQYLWLHRRWKASESDGPPVDPPESGPISSGGSAVRTRRPDGSDEVGDERGVAASV